MKVKKIGIVSLSSGIMGESFISHELKIGKERLNKYGIELEFLPNALKGMDFIKNHPKSRADDLLTAFKDDSIDMILCAIGGEMTHIDCYLIYLKITSWKTQLSRKYF